MGLITNLFRGKELKNAAHTIENIAIMTPMLGEVIMLKDIGDGMFSEGMLGQGCGIGPSLGDVYAPADGIVTMVDVTKHAIGVTSVDGMELLIHVGIDTVAMNGQGFSPTVKQGEKIRQGQLMMKVDLESIKAAGYPSTAVILVTNSDDYSSVTMCKTGRIEKDEKLLEVQR